MKFGKLAAAAAAALLLTQAAVAETVNVGALADVRRNVYGVPPQGAQAVKRKGDAVVFRETLETLDSSYALIRFLDDSKLTLGAKSKVLIDEFVFDPKNVKGNALIEISVGTLRFVTGAMPKGGVVIKTPTATLTLRGTDVVVHVHPDGTTDTTVNEGQVDAHNNVTNQITNLVPGNSASLGQGGTTGLPGGGNIGNLTDNQQQNGDDSPPEHRRSDPPKPDPKPSEPPASNESDDDEDEGCDCI